VGASSSIARVCSPKRFFLSPDSQVRVDALPQRDRFLTPFQGLIELARGQGRVRCSQRGLEGHWKREKKEKRKTEITFSFF